MTAKAIPTATLTEEEWSQKLTITHQEILPYLNIGSSEAFSLISKASGNKEKIEMVIKVSTEEHDDFDLPPEIIFHDIGNKLKDIDNIPKPKLSQTLDKILPKLKVHLKAKRKTLVYCATGITKSVIIVISYLMSSYGVPYDNAFAFVQSKRCQVEVSDNLAKFL